MRKQKKAAPRLLNDQNHDPARQLPLDEVVVRVISLAQVMLDKQFYPYQVSLGSRIVESLLLHDGDVITSLMARQAGKTETIGGVVAAAAVMLPVLAKQYPDDWKLNITDEQGNYRGFSTGLRVGIYAPRLDQSGITFERVRNAFETKSSKRILKELGLTQEVNNGNTVELSHGSSVMCESASEQSKIEGATHHLLIAEEAQDISDMKMRKSLHPMTASTMGTIAKIGTAATKKCDFYTAIQENRRMELLTFKRNHFFFPWTVCSQYNSLYRRYIEKEKLRIGEESDEFRMSYSGEWIFERGMFVTQDVLFNPDVAVTQGLWSSYHLEGVQPGMLKYMALVAGIDWGSSSDSTAVCLMAVDWINPVESGETYDANGAHRYTFYKKYVVGWLEFVGDNYEHQFGEINVRLSSIRNLRKITMDSNACGRPMFDRFAAVYAPRLIEVEPFNFQPKIKSDGYKSLAADLWASRVHFPAGKLVRNGIHYRKFVLQMLDLKKDYVNGIMKVAHPEERGAHDDYCFPAGSPVLTESGELPIEQVSVGMRVVTRQGLKRVVRSQQTGVKRLIRVGNMVGTANHPVFCGSSGMYKRLDALMLDDTVLQCSLRKSSSLTGYVSRATQAHAIGSTVSTFGRILSGNAHLLRCMSTYGKSIVDQFRKSLLFIIRTVTAEITSCPTLCLCGEANISDCTPQSQLESLLPVSIYERRNEQQCSRGGINQSLGASAHLTEHVVCGTRKSLPVKFVQNAVRCILPVLLGQVSLVPVRVRDIVGDAETLQNFENTLGVEVPVYNIEVEGAHEYICQGVLVHNCDAFMLAAWGCNTPATLGALEFEGANPFTAR